MGRGWLLPRGWEGELRSPRSPGVRRPLTDDGRGESVQPTPPPTKHSLRTGCHIQGQPPLSCSLCAVLEPSHWDLNSSSAQKPLPLRQRAPRGTGTGMGFGTLVEALGFPELQLSV